MRAEPVVLVVGVEGGGGVYLQPLTLLGVGEGLGLEGTLQLAHEPPLRH